MTLDWEFAAGQILGTRSEQEDYCEIERLPQSIICVLADGMGGHAAGAIAAKLAVQNFMQVAKQANRPRVGEFMAALAAANSAIASYEAIHPDDSGMGTTLIGVELDSRRFCWISVGDSLVLLRSAAGIKRVNADHSFARSLEKAVENGDMTEEEARNSPSRHMLLSAVTGGNINKVDYNHHGIQVAAGDLLIIASDGLETLSLDEVAALLASAADQKVSALKDRLLDAVSSRALTKQDNTTIIVARAIEASAVEQDLVVTRPIRSNDSM